MIDRATVVLQPPRQCHGQPGWLAKHLREQRPKDTTAPSLVCDVLTAEKTMMDWSHIFFCFSAEVKLPIAASAKSTIASVHVCEGRASD